MTRCKICKEYLVSDTARYCSTECRVLDTQIFTSKYGLIFGLFALLVFIVISMSLEFDLIYFLMIFAGTILMVIVPMYQYYQSALFRQKMKMRYKQSRHASGEMENQPVFIYLYINRHTERLVQDEDYSEFM